MRSRQMHRVATLVVTIAMVAAACGGDDGNDEATADTTASSTTQVAETSTTAAVVEDDTAVDEVEPDDAGAAMPGVFDADAPLITEQFVPIEAGTYRVDTIGTPFSFSTSEFMMVQPNSDVFFVLADRDNHGPDDQDLVFQRVSHLSLPTNPTGTIDEQGDGWPADDIEGWLDELVPGIEVSNRENVSVGGLDAVRFDARLADGFECGVEFCAGVATNRLVSSLGMSPNASYRVWVIDQGEESPIMMHAAIVRDSQIGWFDKVDEVVATLAFGPTEPNPVPTEGDLWTLGFASEVPAGIVELPVLGGIRFELAEDRFIFQAPDEHHFIDLNDRPADTELMIIDRDSNENPISTVDELIEAISTGGITIEEIDGTTLGGFEARVFDLTGSPNGGPPSLITLNGEPGSAGWSPPLAGRLWVSETDRGLVFITAEVFETEDDLPAILEQTELVIATLEFIELN